MEAILREAEKLGWDGGGEVGMEAEEILSVKWWRIKFSSQMLCKSFRNVINRPA